MYLRAGHIERIGAVVHARHGTAWLLRRAPLQQLHACGLLNSSLMTFGGCCVCELQNANFVIGRITCRQSQLEGKTNTHRDVRHERVGVGGSGS